MFIVAGPIRTPIVGTPYSQRFTVVGGTPPYSFTMTPSALGQPTLPPGLTFSSAGVISGTPTSTGSFGFVLRAQDSAGNSFIRSYSYETTSSTGLFLDISNPLDSSVGIGRFMFFNAFSTGTLPSSSFSCTVSAGSLPPGMAIVTSGFTAPDGECTIDGRPSVPGLYTFTLRVAETGNASNFAERVVTFRVAPMQLVPP